MTHSDAGHYAGKHGPDARPDDRIAAAAREKVVHGELSCADAERISATVAVTLGEVGRTLDLMELRICRCQLGLFGYGTHEGKAVQPALTVSPELEGAIRSGLVEGRLPCKEAWEIAARLGIKRMEVSAACETLKIRVRPCQLGAF